MSEDNKMAESLAKQLNKMEKLPGGVFDKAAAWKKLHSRLEKKERAKNPAWIWPVAASFTLLLILLLLSRTHPVNKEAGTITLRDKVKIIPSQANPDKKQLTAVRKAMQENRRTESLSAIQLKQEKKFDTEKQKARNQTELPAINPTVSSNFSAPAMDTIITHAIVLSISSEKKKLKVVHNNELEGKPLLSVEQPEKNNSWVRAIPGIQVRTYEEKIALLKMKFHLQKPGKQSCHLVILLHPKINHEEIFYYLHACSDKHDRKPLRATGVDLLCRKIKNRPAL